MTGSWWEESSGGKPTGATGGQFFSFALGLFLLGMWGGFAIFGLANPDAEFLQEQDISAGGYAAGVLLLMPIPIYLIYRGRRVVPVLNALGKSIGGLLGLVGFALSIVSFAT